MKNGRSLMELAAEIERQAETKTDYVVGTNGLHAGVENGKLVLEVKDRGTFGVNQVAHEQANEWAGIPARYANRMRAEAPQLLATNLNHWLDTDARKAKDAGEKPTARMVRILDGQARAFLSASYRPLDYRQMAESVLPVLADAQLEVLSCEITERRLYLKAVDRRVLVDLPTGRRFGDGSHVFFDTLSPAIVISNSEVGCGALSIETAIYTKMCTNLAIAGQQTLRKYHLGARHELGEDISRLLSDDTRALNDRAVWATARDVVKAAFDELKFKALVDGLKPLTERLIEGDVPKAVEVLGRKLTMTENERGSVLKHLISGGDLSQYGLFNAVTRTAEDLPEYDRATEFERMGGKVIDLAPSEWNQIAKAA